MPMRPRRLSPAAARRVAITASALSQRTPILGPQIPATDAVRPRHLARTLRRLGVIQIDSVNVFARAHYVPLFSRLGPYELTDFDALAGGRTPRVFEYWAHEATLLPIETWPLWQWRRHERATEPSRWREWAEANAAFVSWLRDYITAEGPSAAHSIEHHRNRRTGAWWGWSDVKRGLEWLFLTGELTSAGRANFQRLYATPEQAIPAAIRAAGIPSPETARRALIETAIVNLGVFTLADVADYFRMRKPQVSDVLATLEEEGTIMRVAVDGWRDTAWIRSAQQVPRHITAATLLSPFDPLVWFRPRAERLFNFRYRIEIYTPEPQRIYGYYTLPYMLGDQIVARVDLKADRATSTLQVKSAWREQDAPPHTAAALASSLWQAARWQSLDEVVVHDKGTLATALKVETARSHP